MRRPIYLDYNATTPVDPRVLERMLPYFTERFGNPASKGHTYGLEAEAAVEVAREQVAALLGTSPERLIFTSGATEALNLAIKGVAEASQHRGRHIVTVQTEHAAVLEACRALARRGWDVTYLPVDAQGRLDPDALEEALTPRTVLVAVMWANNETGVLHPIAEIARRTQARDIPLLVDATQAVGKIPVTVEGIDLLACSAHKFYGPKGIGVLYMRQRPSLRLVPLLDGGGHEQGLRSGTLNVPAIVGMGLAAELAAQTLEEESHRLQCLRDRLERALQEALPDLRINGAQAPRLPQTSSVTIPGVRADRLLATVRTLALSAGSACGSGRGRPSHVLRAMGLSEADARCTIRISLGRFTTETDIDYALDQLTTAIRQLRQSLAVPSST
ncbi:cysteine desulfurase family protein [Rhodothermus profundi]|uniref:cysteine desulfurase n=1 Tax=Rhodothermus profundi TaxID=633813 RepID=A0A1M6QMJ9_9BACT|nr:cysteine desulfurase family protein [Rhodothermus profundi]SHK21303.1 cysteine desulfurase IscS [Rhodothermus profundi]